ncbi:MAG: hypothetical protein ACI8SR_003015 [Oceanicoccus sp.]|jgi:hypothetical protein
MKKIFSLALCLLSLNSVALGGFESLTDTEKKSNEINCKTIRSN